MALATGEHSAPDSSFEQSVPPVESIAGGADLHVHSTASDGTVSPADVAKGAARAGLRAIALTDHDTMEGIPEACRVGQSVGLDVIPGVEISASFRGEEIHVLGLFVDWHNANLCERLRDLRKSRENRAERMVARLNELGLEVTLTDVEAQAESGSMGRPHVARALRKRGHVTSVAEAFDRFLARGRPAFVPRLKVSPHEAIDLLHHAGAATALAHPGLIQNEALVPELASLDFDALEVRHSRHSRTQEQLYWQLARQSGLVLTGGSDWHGDDMEDRAPLGDIRVPLEWVTQLRARADTHRQQDSRRDT